MVPVPTKQDVPAAKGPFMPLAIVAGIISLFAVYLTIRLELPTSATFKPVDPASLSATLAPLLVIAILIERTIEVFFGVWREPEDRAAEHKVDAAKQAVTLTALASGAAEERSSTLNALDAATDVQASRKVLNTRLAFLMGGSLGLIAAIAGARVLALLVSKAPDAPTGWNLLDIFLTAGLLGGGADGFHHIMAAISGFLQATQHKAESADPKR